MEEQIPKLRLSLLINAEISPSSTVNLILSRGHAAEALDWTRSVTTRLGLTLNEAKTSIKAAREESFSFLGYTFGPHRYKPDGHWYLGASPSKKSRQRIKHKVGELDKCGAVLAQAKSSEIGHHPVLPQESMVSRALRREIRSADHQARIADPECL